LLEDPELARDLGENARRVARERFGLERFARDWNAAFHRVLAPRSFVPATPELVEAGAGARVADG
jgi:hypothetical protein